MGGNVYTTGPKADGSAWRVGVENPWPGEDAPQYVQTVELTGGDSLIVSGDYQRYFTYEGKRYSHLIDLTTGCPDVYKRQGQADRDQRQPEEDLYRRIMR